MKILKIIFASKLQQSYLQIVATLTPNILQTHIWNNCNFFFLKCPKCIEKIENFSKGNLYFCNFCKAWSLSYCEEQTIQWILTKATKAMKILKVFSSHWQYYWYWYWYWFFKVFATINSQVLHILPVIIYSSYQDICIAFLYMTVPLSGNSPTIKCQCNPLSLKFHRPYEPSYVKEGEEEKLPITGCIAGNPTAIDIFKFFYNLACNHQLIERKNSNYIAVYLFLSYTAFSIKLKVFCLIKRKNLLKTLLFSINWGEFEKWTFRGTEC